MKAITVGESSQNKTKEVVWEIKKSLTRFSSFAKLALFQKNSKLASYPVFRNSFHFLILVKCFNSSQLKLAALSNRIQIQQKFSYVSSFVKLTYPKDSITDNFRTMLKADVRRFGLILKTNIQSTLQYSMYDIFIL